jgi:hypothetical protein
MKILLILLLPIPMLLWPVLAAVGSILVGLGYGIGQPLVATFEAVGEGRESKFYHVFVVRGNQFRIASCLEPILAVNFIEHLKCVICIRTVPSSLERFV